MVRGLKRSGSARGSVSHDRAKARAAKRWLNEMKGKYKNKNILQIVSGYYHYQSYIWTVLHWLETYTLI